jgi:hypothetical protein
MKVMLLRKGEYLWDRIWLDLLLLFDVVGMAVALLDDDNYEEEKEVVVVVEVDFAAVAAQIRETTKRTINE